MTGVAVRTLTSLGIRPRDEAGLRRWIVSLWNADGGFAPRPGMRSDPMATFRVVDMLSALGWLKGIKLSERAKAVEAAHDDLANCHAWTVQFEAPGSGSVKDAIGCSEQIKRALVERESEWRNLRPSELVSVQVLGPKSMFEVARPESGKVLRTM